MALGWLFDKRVPVVNSKFCIVPVSVSVRFVYMNIEGVVDGGIHGDLIMFG